MDIKAYSFEQNSHALAQIKLSVSESCEDSGIYFNSFSDPKALFGELGEAVKYADAILIGVESKVYLKFKPIFIDAFGFTPAYSEKIGSAVESITSDEKVQKAHALIPDESTELLTDDGLYSGFYIKENDQYIVVFPLMESAVPAILQKPELPFFKLPENKPEIFHDILEKEEASPKAETIINKLRKNDYKLAIPQTPAVKIFKTDIKECDEYGDFVFFTPFVNDTGIEDPKQYSAQLAKGAMDLRNTELGATISNVFREKKGGEVQSYYVFVSVATGDKVVVKKLFADPDESVDNLVTEATYELYSMIDKYIDELAFKAGASDEDFAKYEQSIIESEVVSEVRPEASISKKGAIVAIIALILAIVACIALALKFGGYFVTSNDDPTGESIQAGAPTAPTTTTTEPAAIPENTIGELTEPPSETNIFEVTTTLPIPDTTFNIIYQNNNNNNYNYNNNNNNTTREDTTKATTEPTTQATTKATTQPTEAPVEDVEF